MKSLLLILKKTILVIVVASAFVGCKNNQHAFVSTQMANNNWSYINKIKLTTDITDIHKVYNVYVTLRHTNDYQYSNIFVMFNLKGNQQHLKKRIEYRLALPDGAWTGKGSGDLFTNNFLLLKNYTFKKPGKYIFEIEQDMRDNPLKGISDVSIYLEIVE